MHYKQMWNKNITNRDSRYRVCQQFDETVDHILSAYPILAEEECISRHDSVCGHLHFNVCKEMGIKLDKLTLVSA
jgi:hypothetical protein